MIIAAILGSSSPDGPLLDNLAFDHVCASNVVSLFVSGV
jgi:hypothetical protein